MKARVDFEWLELLYVVDVIGTTFSYILWWETRHIPDEQHCDCEPNPMVDIQDDSDG